MHSECVTWSCNNILVRFLMPRRNLGEDNHLPFYCLVGFNVRLLKLLCVCVCMCWAGLGWAGLVVFRSFPHSRKALRNCLLFCSLQVAIELLSGQGGEGDK